jgi:predicted TIM-barrel fold metal-dependent hydrolase
MTRLDFAVPAGACDSHVHVFPGADRYPYVAKRAYTPPDAPVAALESYLAALGLARVVIVQPSIHGAGNAAVLDTVAALGAERARGVAVIGEGIGDAALENMDCCGVRGIRVNLEMEGESDPARAGQRLRQLAGRIQGLGWHIQLFCQADMVAALADRLADLPVPVVLDHFGGIRTGRGPGQAGFEALLSLLKAGNIYVKASGAYLCPAAGPDFADVIPFARAVIAANPDRIVWGSNWPHPDGTRGQDPVVVRPFLPMGNAETLNLLAAWADEGTRQKILVDNPARLYGFQGA